MCSACVPILLREISRLAMAPISAAVWQAFRSGFGNLLRAYALAARRKSSSPIGALDLFEAGLNGFMCGLVRVLAARVCPFLPYPVRGSRVSVLAVSLRRDGTAALLDQR